MILRIVQLGISCISVAVKRILNVFVNGGGKINFSPLSIWNAGIKLQLLKNGSISVDKKSRITGHGLIRSSAGILKIGEHCDIRDCCIQANKGSIEIGDNTFINSNSFIVSCEKISIGKNCAFGPGVSIFDQDHVIVRDGIPPWNETKTAPIVIGDNYWIGANVLILRGTEIGDNCVIAGGTVVKGKIPPHSLVKNNRELIITEIH